MPVQSVYVVVGMTCDHCVQAVTSELSGIPGVGQVAVDLATGEASVTSAEPLDIDVVRTAVGEAGYELAAAHA